MNNITVIVPVHEVLDKDGKNLLQEAVKSVVDNEKNYKGELKTLIVCSSEEVKENLSTFDDGEHIKLIVNDGEKKDFCSQVNFGVQNCDTDYFSILEYDDTFTENWFSMAYNYVNGKDDVSIVLPLTYTDVVDEQYSDWYFNNELVWATSFSNELGVIDFDCLESSTTFTLGGGIFNKADFVELGMLKSTIQLGFDYEFFLRATHYGLKVIVAPKLGYYHRLGRKGSYSDQVKTMDKEVAKRWFELAKREYTYKKDRYKTILTPKKEQLK